MTRIVEMSDIHLEFGPEAEPRELPDGDVCILAGDICVAAKLQEHRNDASSRSHQKLVRSFFQKLNEKYEAILYVTGNHEAYNGDIDKINDTIQGFLTRENLDSFIFLNNKTWDRGDIRFIGTPLWTDFNAGTLSSLNAARMGMNDFHVISKGDARFTPEDALHMFYQNALFLHEQLVKDLGRCVVITHHAPSRMSINPKYFNEVNINGAYASDLEHLMLSRGPELWFHGHMHDAADYTINKTRVICNPKGYPGTIGFRRSENPDWKPIVVEI